MKKLFVNKKEGRWKSGKKLVKFKRKNNNNNRTEKFMCNLNVNIAFIIN